MLKTFTIQSQTADLTANIPSRLRPALNITNMQDLSLEAGDQGVYTGEEQLSTNNRIQLTFLT